MSRRPRTPLALRPLASQPTSGADVGLDAPSTLRLPAPPVRSAAARLAPPLSTAAQPLAPPVETLRLPADGGHVELRELDVRPTVDVAPESLRTAVFALRSERCALPVLAAPKRTPLLAAEARGVAVPRPPHSEGGLPPAAFARTATPIAPASLPGEVLRRCLETLFRASGAAGPHDLRLVGIYPRMPVGAIAGVALSDGVLTVRLGRGPATSGMLVVGRRISTGALATAEVAEDGSAPAPARGRRRRS